MINKKRLTSIFRSPYQIYFKNGAPNPAGDLLMAGIGVPTKKNSWEDTRKFWAYPYYSVNIMLGDGVGSYHNDNGFTCELSQGNFFLNFPDVMQHYAPALGEAWGELFISFAGTLFDILRENELMTPRQPVWLLEKPEVWIKRLQAFLEKPVPTLPQEKLRRAMHFQEYLLTMLEQAKPVHACRTDIDWFDKACHLLTRDLHHAAALPSIAGALNMSYHTFRLYFKRRSGMSPARYRDQARIKAACEYLVTNPIKRCKEIAFELGYCSEEQFSKQFKLHTGLTPLEYRRKNQAPVAR
jgi:AraC-like DNA-binding protein